MKHLYTALMLILLLALLVPAIAYSKWTVQPPIEYNVIDYTQAFVAIYNATGQGSVRQNVSACDRPVVAISDQTARVLVFDCPSEDVVQTSCSQVADMGSETGITSIEAQFPGGWVHYQVLDVGIGGGAVTATCRRVRNQVYNDSSDAWQDLYTMGLCTEASP